MKIKILSFISVILVLLSFLAVPALAAVPDNSKSNVNFFDMSLMNGRTAYLVENDNVVEVVTVAKAFDMLYCGFTTEQNPENSYFVVFDITYAECMPNYTETAYDLGLYAGFVFNDMDECDVLSSCVDDGQLHFSSIGFQSYQDFMSSNVCIELVTMSISDIYKQFTFLQNNTIVLDYAYLRYDYLSSLYTPYNSDYFITSDDDGSYDQGYSQGYGQGYTDGVLAGEQSGYDKGYSAGYDKGVIDGISGIYDDFKPNANVFEYATFQVILSYEGERVYTGSISPDISVGSIDFKRALDSLWDEYPYDYAKITATWTDEYKWVLGQFSLGISGTGDMDTLKVVNGVDGKSYYLEATEDYNLAVRPISFTPDQDVIYPVYVTQMVFDGLEGAFANFALVVGSKDFNNGYNAGYVDGIKSADGVIYDQGYDAGHRQGFLEGKNEGLLIAENGSFSALFAAVLQAPVNAFSSLFNFEVLGMDMRAFVGSLISLCIVVIIVKKIIGV